MEPCIPGVGWSGGELWRLFPEATEVVELEERLQGLTVDSRCPVAGGIFVALQGKRVDAHTKLPEAFAGGVRLAIVDQAVWNHFPVDWRSYRCLPVVSPRKALAELARVHRQRFQIPIIAVVGSAGKTTTKELIAAVLAQRFRVLKTVGNENNQLGVSLTLLQLRAEHEVAVLELGTNSFGEIARLCQIVQPTHGVVTAIGEEHLEFLGTLAGVVQEETALVRFLRHRGGKVFVPAEEPLLPAEDITFGLTPRADVWAAISYDEAGYPILQLHYGGELVECRLRLVGEAAARAAVAAAAVAWEMGLSAEELREGLSTYRPSFPPDGAARMLLVHLPNGVRFLNDTYNANPLSMRYALETLRRLPCPGRRWAVLGDMLELGAATSAAHRMALEQACAVADCVCLLGDTFASFAPAFPNVRVCSSHREAAEYLWQWVQPGDLVLLKGSRKLQMERILSLYRQRLDAKVEHHAVPFGGVDMEDL